MHEYINWEDERSLRSHPIEKTTAQTTCVSERELPRDRDQSSREKSFDIYDRSTLVMCGFFRDDFFIIWF